MRATTHRHIALAAGLLLAVSLAGSAWAAHPQTVWDAADLARLQSARGTTHAALADNLKALLDKSEHSGPGDALAGYAMAARIWEQDNYKAAAVAKLKSYCNTTWQSDHDLFQSRGLIHGAIAYDVLYDLLDPGTRDACRARISSSAADLAQAATGGIWWVQDMVQNHNWVNFAAIGIAGQALEGEDPNADQWRALADENFRKIKVVQDLVSDGSWHEGIGYLSFGLEHMTSWSIGAARRGGELDKTELLHGLGRYILYNQQPNHPRVHVMMHGDWNWVRPGLQACLRWAGRRFQDPHAQEAARRWELEPRMQRDEFGFSYALEYVAYDPAVPLPDMNAVPLDLYAEDLEAAILRDSWEWGDGARSIVMALKAGVYGGRGNYERMRNGDWPGGLLNFAHDHQDDLGLWIYGNGGWLLPEAVAYNCCTGTPDYHSTAWHNTLMFDGRGQLGDDKLPGRASKLHGDAHPWFLEREASIPMRASTAHYAFARGDGQKLYPAELGIQALARTVGIARQDGYMTLHDRAELGTPRKVEQLFHSQEPSSNASPWVQLVNQDDTILGIRVVSPAGYVANVSTQQSNSYQEKMDNDGQFGLVKVALPAPQTHATFLEVLWPAKGNTWGQRPDVQPLDADNPGRGFKVPLGASTESWIYADAERTAAGELVLEGGSGDEIGIARAASDGAIQAVALNGKGRLLDQGGARTLLDLGSHQGAVEVAFSGTSAELSGLPELNGVMFWGPEITDVLWRGQPVPFKREGSMITITADQSLPSADPMNLPQQVSSGAGSQEGAGCSAVGGGGAMPVLGLLFGLLAIVRMARGSRRSTCRRR